MSLLQLSCILASLCILISLLLFFFPPILPPCLPASSIPLLPSLQIYSQTHDEHFHLIVVDYHSEDLDVEEELKKSSLRR